VKQVQKHSTVEVEVDAVPEAVWAVVADVTRVGEWSHECRSVEWLAGADGSQGARPGARFRGRNRASIWTWSRTSEVLQADAPRTLAWRTLPTRLFPDSTEWRIELEPSGTGTRIRQSFHVVRAPWLLDRLYARLIPSHQDRDARLVEDLRRIGEVARSAVST
jgi:hypothetical protein